MVRGDRNIEIVAFLVNPRGWPASPESAWKPLLHRLVTHTNIPVVCTSTYVEIKGDYGDKANLDSIAMALNSMDICALYIDNCLPYGPTMERLLSLLRMHTAYSLNFGTVPIKFGVRAINKFLASEHSRGLFSFSIKNMECLNTTRSHYPQLRGMVDSLTPHPTVTKWCIQGCALKGMNCHCQNGTMLEPALKRNTALHTAVHKSATRLMVISRVLVIAKPHPAHVMSRFLVLPLEILHRILTASAPLLTPLQIGRAIAQAMGKHPVFPPMATRALGGAPLDPGGIAGEHGEWLDAGGFFYGGSAVDGHAWWSRQREGGG